MVDLVREQELDVLIELSNEYGKIYKNYSGRGMYGRTCYGIVTSSDPAEVIASAEEQGLTDGRADSLGLDVIVYWPHFKPEADDDDYLGD